MTSQSASQSLDSSAGRTDDVPPAWDERTTLTTMLDYARDTVHAKCAGLSDADARRAPLPGSPLMTISGLVSHLRWVESSWIEQTCSAALSTRRGPTKIPTASSGWRSRCRSPGCWPSTGPPATGTATWSASLDLDTPSRGALDWRAEPVTLRWILLHLTEETARHNGHLDILRELADGTRGR